MLKGVKRGTRKPPRVVLYGPPGVGKSTFGADSPNPIIVTTEDGVDNLPVDQFPKAVTWAELLENARQVAEGEHEYETIVLDTLNGATRLAGQNICDTVYGGQWVAQKGNGGFQAYGNGWKATSEEMRSLIVSLDKCRDRGMLVILLGHTGLHNVRHPTDGEYNKFAPDIDKFVWSRFSEWSDIVLRADYEFIVQRGEKRGTKGRVIGTSTRIMYSVGSAAEDAKCRVGYELPEQLGLDFAEFTVNLGNDLQTLEQVQELWSLLDKDTAKATMAWMGVSKLEDAPVTKMRTVLNRLRQKQGENQEKEDKDTKEEVTNE